MLIGVPIRLVNLVEIDLFQIRFDEMARLILDMNIMFVRRITAPVSARRIYFHQYESMYWRPRRQQIIDLATHVVAPANGNSDVLRLDEPGFVVLIRWNPGDCKFTIAFRHDSEVGIARQIKRRCRTRPHILSLQVMPTATRRTDGDRPAKKNDRQFIFTTAKGPRIACRQLSDLKRDKIPTR